MSNESVSLVELELAKSARFYGIVLILGGAAASIAGVFDTYDDLFTVWDHWGVSITSPLYILSGVILLFRPQWVYLAMAISFFPTAIYQQGVMFMAVHFPSKASYYSAASSGAFFPLSYLVLFITLPKGATKWSSLNCLGFYIQYLLNHTILIPAQEPHFQMQGQHLMFEAMMAHPIYIASLRYIVTLRERMYRVQQESHRALVEAHEATHRLQVESQQNKEKLLAMMSHEIKNQLQTMIGSIDLLQFRAKSTQDKKSFQHLLNSAVQLDTYLSDVRQMTRLENPEFTIEVSQFDIHGLLDEIVEDWQPQALEAGLSLTLVPPDASTPALVLESDRTRLRQVISNLVSNGLKYSMEGGLTLSARLDSDRPGYLLLTVSDTGIGMDQDDIKKIFLPYVRLKNAETLRQEGSGLGLAIVKMLVDSMNGEIQVESELNKGTSFQLRLPLKY